MRLYWIYALSALFAAPRSVDVALRAMICGLSILCVEGEFLFSTALADGGTRTYVAQLSFLSMIFILSLIFFAGTVHFAAMHSGLTFIVVSTEFIF